MKKKSVIGLLAVALLVIVPILTACNVTTVIGDGTWETPHSLTGGYANCFICHTGGLSATPPSTHLTFTLEQCARPECHPVMEGVEVSLATTESID